LLKKYSLFFLLLFLIASVTFGCSAMKNKVAASVTILEIGSDYIIVQEQGRNSSDRISVPPIITKLIEVNKEYYIQYEYFDGGSFELVSIAPDF